MGAHKWTAIWRSANCMCALCPLEPTGLVIQHKAFSDKHCAVFDVRQTNFIYLKLKPNKQRARIRRCPSSVNGGGRNCASARLEPLLTLGHAQRKDHTYCATLLNLKSVDHFISFSEQTYTYTHIHILAIAKCIGTQLPTYTKLLVSQWNKTLLLCSVIPAYTVAWPTIFQSIGTKFLISDKKK